MSRTVPFEPLTGRSLAALSLLTLFPVAAAAQLPCNEVDIYTGNFACIGSPFGGPGEAYGATAVGDLDGDLTVDLAVLRGTTLYLMAAPAVLEEAQEVRLEAYGVCYSPGGAGLQTPSFFYTTSEGLRRVHVAGPGVLTDELVGGSGTSLFAEARIAYDPSEQQIVGVRPDDRTFVSAKLGVELVLQPEVHFTLAQDVLAFEPLDWDGLGTAVGILRPNGVQIRRLQGGSVLTGRSTPTPGQPEAIAVVRKEGLSDALAWLVDLGNPQTPVPPATVGDPQQSIVLFRAVTGGGLAYQDPVALASSGWVDLAAGDLDGNGAEELVLSPGSGDSLRTLDNVSSAGSWQSPAGATFAGAAGMTVPMLAGLYSGEELSSPTFGPLLCADFFNDLLGGVPLPGFAVVLPEWNGVRLVPHPFALQARSGGKVGFSPPPANPDFDSATWYPCPAGSPDVAPNCTTFEGTLGWTGAQGDWAIGLGTGWSEPVDATEIELIVRLQRPNQMPSGAAWHHWFFCISSTGTTLSQRIDNTEIRFARNRPGAPPPTPLISFQDPFYSDPQRFYAMVRPVKRGANGALLSAGRWSILSMVADCNWYEDLVELNGSGDPLGQIIEACGPIAGGCPPLPLSLGPDSRYIPRPVPQTRIPGPIAWPTVLQANY